MSILRQRIRMACDPGKDESPIDLITGLQPNIRRGADLQFELALLWNGTLRGIDDLASITLEVRLTRTGAPVISKQVLAAAMDNTLDAASWADESKQHALVIFSNEETAAFTITSPVTEIEPWLIVKALTTSGEVYDWTYGVIKVTEVGLGSTGAPEAGNPTYYTAAQVDALIAAILSGTAAFNAIKIYNPTLDDFVLAQPEGEDPSIKFGFKYPTT